MPTRLTSTPRRGGPRRPTFGQLDQRSNRLARLLIGRGLKPGDRLAVYLANRIEFVDLILACLKAGIILVPVNILYREREVGHILRDAEPGAVVDDPAGVRACSSRSGPGTRSN